MNKEDIYIQKLKKYVNSKGINKLSKIKKLQIDFFTNAINDLNKDNNQIDTFYKYCRNISEITNLKVHRHNKIINENSIIISNHIGLAKLIKLRLNNLSLNALATRKMKNLENNESYILRIANIITHLLSNSKLINIHPVTIKYNYPFSEICKKSSFILLDKGNNFNKIKKYIQNSIKKSKQPQYFIFFPEGRTSGKYNNKGIFDLDTFHTGFYELSKQTGLPIVSYTQFFTPSINFHIDIMKHNRKHSIDEIRHFMQTQLLNKLTK